MAAGKRLTPREIAVTTGKTVLVYSSGFACFIGPHSEKEARMLERAKITDEDWDNVYYPDGTSELERMQTRGISEHTLNACDDILRKMDALGIVEG